MKIDTHSNKIPGELKTRIKVVHKNVSHCFIKVLHIKIISRTFEFKVYDFVVKIIIYPNYL
jgi:hypothetical protein